MMPSRILPFYINPEYSQKVIKIMDSDRDTEECPICLDTIAPAIKFKTPCNHTFCTYCLLKTNGCNWKCPCCRQNIAISNISASDGNPIAKVASTTVTPDVLNVEPNVLKICVTCGEHPSSPWFPACNHVQCKLCLLLNISNNDSCTCTICVGKLSLRTTVDINRRTIADPLTTPFGQIYVPEKSSLGFGSYHFNTYNSYIYYGDPPGNWKTDTKTIIPEKIFFTNVSYDPKDRRLTAEIGNPIWTSGKTRWKYTMTFSPDFHGLTASIEIVTIKNNERFTSRCPPLDNEGAKIHEGNLAQKLVNNYFSQLFPNT